MARRRAPDPFWARSFRMAIVSAPPDISARTVPRIDAQPIVDLAGGELVREELLLRLVTGTGRVLAPASFINDAERTGAITSLDRLVVRAGAVAAARGRRVAVNLSGRTLGDPGFLEVVERAVAHNRLAPGALMFELAETTAIPSLKAARGFARRAAELGCTFALDDFGAGYAGLTYLDWFPFSAIKIDAGVVADLRGRRRQRSQAMVEAIVEVARTLELQTIAEGVDGSATLEALRDLGVDHGQGFFIGAPQAFVPMPASDN